VSSLGVEEERALERALSLILERRGEIAADRPTEKGAVR
jgi:hypothetical protein